MKEIPLGSNKDNGGFIDSSNKFCGLYKVPWCASSQSLANFKGEVISPKIRSARAKDFATGKTHSLNDLIMGLYAPKYGDYRVKTRRGGNHVDVFIEWNDSTKSGFIIGGNVSDRVTIRKVTLQSMIADGTTHITEVEY
ncbi:MAG: hypothetical protein ACLFQX_08225 [Candidatus Kapaibacterium sp.]